jgi:hypothetical protein
MPSKNTSRILWVLLFVIVAAFFVYVSFASRTSRPQPQDEFPSEQVPVRT